MCDNVAIDVVDSGIAVQLETPVWKVKAGCNCDIKDACDFQFTQDIACPDYF